jgi:hypothetical protein
MKKYTPPPTLSDLKKERDKLMISKENPARLKVLINKINYIEYGI